MKKDTADIIAKLTEENAALKTRVESLEEEISYLENELEDAQDRLACVLDSHPQAVDTLIDHGFPMSEEDDEDEDEDEDI